ncbi:TetM/TetW/TetO/TetS family tetracycline resistance ribosomal protection protein [Asanoa sp. WMMD1127]|uniref:elongation factor G n=1 Tax=Asanoa sp. WMMD1127 TaxID=3016107 RepID=UPI002417C583|nr:TetM/TetW/TetO/TetS family tetracycline resistance ribosomal protection protein [Asanoa sp. WMMD1127]MDG4825897.1 TetM/TetW/TetO/TetS family tetracycline resistance ribosomal protection protein [Asanoa sp. WMMD1127]
MRTLNLGILAHVDAGKTSLTERLLHAAGVIEAPGSVDDGSTQTDSLALERQRGITIKSAVVSFPIDGVTVNLIDTPGHPDFIAEVERVLAVLDGAVLVVSAVEGVQPQTRVLTRALRRLGIPLLVFVNKVDRAGARPDAVVADLARRLGLTPQPMGTVRGAGARDATFHDGAAGLVDLLAQRSDAVLRTFVDHGRVAAERLRAELAAQTAQGWIHPVYAGSAITGAGVAELMTGIRDLLPTATGDPAAPPSGAVFKVERGAAGERLAYVRMFDGTLTVRDKVQTGQAEAKVTGIDVFDGGARVTRPAVSAGRIAVVRGLTGVRVGDPVGTPRPGARRHFPPPSLETVVVPDRPGRAGALHAALTELAEQDPLINLRRDDVRDETSVSLYGEVQKEVIEATLADEYGLAVTFRESTTICVERVQGTGAAHELKHEAPFLATVGLRVEPGPVDSGIAFRLGVELGSMPPAFFAAVEETVHEVLRAGPHGWQVVDCVVTMTHSGYYARQSHAHGTFDKSMSSTAGDFRNLTPLVLMAALRQARTAVHEPVHAFRLELPADLLGAVLPVLAKHGALPTGTQTTGATAVVEGDIPAARVHALETRLPSLTRGEGVLESAFDHYRPAPCPWPERPRTDHNPLDRREYLLHVQRRV